MTYIEMDNTVDNYKGATGEALMIDGDSPEAG